METPIWLHKAQPILFSMKGRLVQIFIGGGGNLKKKKEYIFLKQVRNEWNRNNLQIKMNVTGKSYKDMLQMKVTRSSYKWMYVKWQMNVVKLQWM